MNFFGWHGSGGTAGSRHEDGLMVSATSSRAAATVTRLRPDSSSLGRLEPAAALQSLLEGPNVPLFVRPLAATVGPLCEALRGVASQAQEALVPLLHFLEPCKAVNRQLELALGIHTDKAATVRVLACVDTALTALRQSPDLAEARSSWRSTVEALTSRCQEVFELYFYLVFLDLKGDTCLFEQTARELACTLGLTLRGLLANVAAARPWAEAALKAIAGRKHLDLLRRQHAAALSRWRSLWEERMATTSERSRFVDEAGHGTKFWDSFFTHLFKIAWPDFLEAFEHYYILESCPVDIVNRLRNRVDPLLVHQVSKSRWMALLEERSRIWDLLDMLLEEILQDLAARIYLPEPLGLHSGQVITSQPPKREGARAEHNQVEFSSPNSESGSNQAFQTPPPSALSQALGDATSQYRSSAPSPPSSQPHAAAARPKPWFPFAHNTTDDADMAIPTPHDLRVRQGGSSDMLLQSQPHVSWDEYMARRCPQQLPWWYGVSEATSVSLSESEKTQLWAAMASALRVVSGITACTNRALVFRVVSGNLAQNRPILELPRRGGTNSSSDLGGGDVPLLPALVITANGTRFNGVTKFGRSSSRRTLLPDCPMTEPIASRSHFNVVYEQETDNFYLMDAGSKWGTFVKIGASVQLSCGDWIRVGGVEFIIRYCGGGCSCSKKHAHYRLHSLRLLKEHEGFSQSKGGRLSTTSARRSSSPGSPGCVSEGNASRGGCLSPTPSSPSAADDGESSEDERAARFQDELLLLLSSRRPRGWTTASARLCQKDAQLQGSGVEVPDPGAAGTRSALRKPHLDLTSPKWRCPSIDASPLSTQAMCLPIAPLELDFISGPRMGEKLVLYERVCTLGRGDGNTIQVSDSQLASVSRVHCIFEYSGNRWHMRDNGSTNGTWRRLSCVLEPSLPTPLGSGVAIQAGVHEFLVEEAEMRHPWIPSVGSASFASLCEQERIEEQQQLHSDSPTEEEKH